MFCVSCGKENEDDANFCYKCGKDLSKYHEGGDIPKEAEIEPIEETGGATIESEVKTIEEPIIMKEDEIEPEKDRTMLEEEIKRLNSKIFELENENKILKIERDKYKELNQVEREESKKTSTKSFKKTSEEGLVDKFKRWYNE
ncbi:MAG: zinc-ribbon domain-containing protein [Euryarchaeota archaeon]|nr:zinc-ribbon domain-containing protein [Euryarchaeota archaeon]